MVLRNISDNMKMKPSLVPAVRTTGTVNGTAIDLQGFDAASVLVSVGAYTDGTHTISVQHSDDGVSFADVAASDLSGTLTAIDSDTFDNTVIKTGYLGNKRYVRLVVDVTGATSGAAMAGYVLASLSHNVPV